MARTEVRGGQILDASVSLTADVTGTLPIANGGTSAATLPSGLLKGAGTGAITAATAGTDYLVADANGNISADAFLRGFTTTATAAGTTTMTITDKEVNEFTGSTTQTVRLPTTSVPAGALYRIINNSTGAVTVQSSGANTIVILAGSTSAVFTALVATPTTAAHWEPQYLGLAVASGKSSTLANSIAFAGTDGTTITFPAVSGTLAGLRDLGMTAPVQGVVNGGETYTIVAGTVTQIAGTTISGGVYSPAVGDRILIGSAPASNGVGSLNSTQPGNGVYVVTGNTTNLTLTRAADWSGSVHPAGLKVYNESTTTSFTQNELTVTSPALTSTAFTWGTTAVKFTQSGGVQATWNNIDIGSYFRMWNGGGWLTVQPNGSGSTATVIFPQASGTLATTKPRVVSVSNTTSWTINSDTTDFAENTGLTGAVTINNPTGTPTQGQRLWMTLTGTASRAISYGTAFEDSTVIRPTTTSGTNALDIGFRWNSVTSKWRCVAYA